MVVWTTAAAVVVVSEPWMGTERRGMCGGEVGVRHMESLVKGPLRGRECACAGEGEAAYNRWPLGQRFDSNRQKRTRTDRQISRQTTKTAEREGWDCSEKSSDTHGHGSIRGRQVYCYSGFFFTVYEQ